MRYDGFFDATLGPFMKDLRRSTWLGALSALLLVPSANAVELVNTIEIPGEAVDLVPGIGANVNRLGMGSDLAYDRRSHTLYTLADRGPGGGVISYETRVHKAKVNFDGKTGKISNFRLQQTIKFKTADGFQPFNGLNPLLLNGNVSTLGLSFDPEGLAIAPNGNFYISDEYGPSVYEFRRFELLDGTVEARFVRAFEVPSNIAPYAGNILDYVSGRGTLTAGRQDNRGYEGLTMSPDGTKLFAILQDPLINEGPTAGEGRRSRNVRIVEYDVASGVSTRQYVYQLETLAEINARIPGTAFDFTATAQGRNIGCSGIVAINENEFFVIERDNRGRGVDDPLSTNPVGSKRVFRINISGATNVANMSLIGHTTTLPEGVAPVQKQLYLDVFAEISNRSITMPEKIEGLLIGPELRDGTYALLVANDNDFSVTQNSSNVQFDVYTDGTQGPINGDPMGRSLIPSLIMSFKGSVPGFVAPNR